MPTVEMERRQVVVIGAGPSGAIAAALLKRHGHDVLIIEREHFPRFSIGESLLSHCIDFIEEAGMLDAVQAAGFQVKPARRSPGASATVRLISVTPSATASPPPSRCSAASSTSCWLIKRRCKA